ncbi:AAA family ATPase [Angustibacter sp. McL0619]|uniref:AAA family ATPase n=1 Tax=Angustibacter sp. McL0619 TaxID=3415676 RepID=UPI003CF7F73E
MRLHRLRMEAFGPFAGTEEVDFDELAGLFLLHGPTGAGKSSVLDAVCFALYGQLPGARAAGRPHLRSDHAPADAAPKVVLEVTIGGRRLEVTRSPEWQRPKKRGSGTTKQPAATDVRELVDGQWQVLVGRRNDEAGLLLKDLLGMGLDQFTKVVLLPQGEFAAFLRSSAEQRGDVLRRLFDIDRYSDAETWLRDERGRLFRQVDEADAERDRLVARAHQAASALTGAVAEAVDELAMADPPGTQVVQALASVAARTASEAQVGVATARVAADSSAVELAQALDLSRRQLRLAELTGRLAEVQARGKAHADDVRRLARARSAEQLRLLVRRLDDTRARAARTTAAVQSSGDAVRLALGWAPVDGDPRRDPERVLQDCSAQLARTAGVRAQERDLTHAQQRLRQTTRELEDCERALAGDERELDDAERLHREATARLAEHQGLAGRIAEHEQLMIEAQSIWAAAQALRGCDLEVSQLEDACRQSRDAELQARSAWLDARELRIAGMAAELASGLEPHVPCVVCGSPDHPHPAAASDDHVDAKAERALAKRHELAVRSLQTCEQELAAANTRRAEVRAASRGVEAEAAKAEVQRLTMELERARAASEVVLVAERALDGAEAARVALLSRRESNQHRRTAAASRIAELEPRVTELAQALSAALGDADDVASLEARLREQVRALTAHRDARDGAAIAHSERQALDDDLAQALVALGFTDLDDVRTALLDEPALTALQTAVDEHKRILAQVQGSLSDPELRDLDDAPAPELAVLQAASQEHGRALAECTERHTIAAQAAQALNRLVEQLTVHEQVHHDLRRRAAHVEELSRCVDGTGGGNSLRMRLSSFVLAARLEDVAAAATERLAVMSDGRYTLAHTDELAKSGARSGLGLHVMDSWTGVARETSTLSGGETFLASLALALGLADVVQAEAGGTTIETLFVDEGFGTLDEDTLEEVMGVLDGLRDGGRAVGLVSHVRELRGRIPSQLEVRRQRNGSSIQQHSGLAG